MRDPGSHHLVAQREIASAGLLDGLEAAIFAQIVQSQPIPAQSSETQLTVKAGEQIVEMRGRSSVFTCRAEKIAVLHRRFVISQRHCHLEGFLGVCKLADAEK
ncbi:hypothetical protein ACFP9V_08855 [Deinococcus radiopugnans]|uniref:hypothetical protein n=1 Tax=Deinococcus radiopugnans TaxID=57497 RepID=UPI00360D81FF